MVTLKRRVRVFLVKSIKIAVLLSTIILLYNQLILLTSPPEFKYAKCEKYIDKLKSGELKFNSIESKRTLYMTLDDDDLAETVEAQVYYRPYLNCLDQEDPFLARIIRTHYLIKGDPTSRKLESFKRNHYSSQVHDLINKVFKTTTNGVFIECGSYDGEDMSISLPFEMERNWTGLLIEANPVDYELGLRKNRNVYYMNACLGLTSRPHFSKLKFEKEVEINKTYVAKAMAGLVPDMKKGEGVEVQCFPFFSVYKAIKAAGYPTINLLILDIEGAELDVLQTLPWDKVDIQVMTVETDILVSEGGSVKAQDMARRFIISKNYSLFKHTDNFNKFTGLQNNDLFIRNDLVEKYSSDLEQIQL